MAFTRKWLAALGIEPEKVDEIIAAHAEVVDALKEDRDKYKADAEKLESVQTELDQLKAKPDDGYKDKYEREHSALEKLKEDTAKEKTRAAKEAAFREILKDAGITAEKAVAKVLKYTDFDGEGMELGEDGKFADAKALLKAVKTEWGELVTTTTTKGADTSTPPGTGGVRKSKDEIMAIKDTAERQRAIAENHELFGF